MLPKVNSGCQSAQSVPTDLAKEDEFCFILGNIKRHFQATKYSKKMPTSIYSHQTKVQ
jgi:hypothetical protein